MGLWDMITREEANAFVKEAEKDTEGTVFALNPESLPPEDLFPQHPWKKEIGSRWYSVTVHGIPCVYYPKFSAGDDLWASCLDMESPDGLNSSEIVEWIRTELRSIGRKLSSV